MPHSEEDPPGILRLPDRSFYREAIKLYLAAGVEESNPEICRLYYNIGAAYLNSGMYAEALNIYKYLKKINSEYDPELIDEKIEKASDLKKLYE